MRDRLARLKFHLRSHPYYTALGAVVLLSGGALAWLLLTHHSVADPIQAAKNHLSAKTAPSPLTGLPVSIEEARRPVVAVMIENTPEARPQSGLERAGLVYEAYAEGAITRFMAVSQLSDDQPVGPVRSMRTYYLDWASELKALLAHVGGNMDALDLIPSSTVYDLDEFSVGGAAYWRDQSRYAPHNMYTNLQKLRAVAQGRGYPEKATFAVWQFKDALKSEQRPESAEFTVGYGGAYTVRWVYDKASNRYTRYQGGAPHTDRASGKAVTASNVIVQTVTQSNIKTRIGEEGLRLDTVGTGPAQFFQDGGVQAGTWRKTAGAKTRFYLEDGTELKLNRGPTWISVIPPHVSAG